MADLVVPAVVGVVALVVATVPESAFVAELGRGMFVGLVNPFLRARSARSAFHACALMPQKSALWQTPGSLQ